MTPLNIFPQYDGIETDDFCKPKIIYPNMTKFMPFVYDDRGFVTNQKFFIIPGERIAFLTVFLNSSLFKYCFVDNFPKLGDEGRELSKIFFDKIPVIEVDDAVDYKFRPLVEDIQKTYTKEKAIAIDWRLFDLYDLTDEEREAVGHIEIK